MRCTSVTAVDAISPQPPVEQARGAPEAAAAPSAEQLELFDELMSMQPQGAQPLGLTALEGARDSDEDEEDA